MSNPRIDSPGGTADALQPIARPFSTQIPPRIERLPGARPRSTLVGRSGRPRKAPIETADARDRSRGERIAMRYVLLSLWLGAMPPTPPDPGPRVHDVVIYGGTSAGIGAAVQAARMGKSVVVVSPDHHLGGLTSGGLGWTDSGRKEAIGGLAREFYRRIKAHYDRPEAWTRQKPEEYRLYRRDDDALWAFEPHVAERVFEAMVAEHGIPVVRERMAGPRARRREGRDADRRDPDPERQDLSRPDVHRRHLRRRPDGRRRGHVHRRPRGERASTARRSTASRPVAPTSISSSGRSIPTTSPATRRAACSPASTPALPARTARATTASRRTASACA